MSLATAGIYCTISPPLLRGNRRLFHSPSPIAANALSPRHKACSACCGTYMYVVVAQEHRRQDSSHTMAKYQPATNKRASPHWSRHAGWRRVTVATGADGAPVIAPDAATDSKFSWLSNRIESTQTIRIWIVSAPVFSFNSETTDWLHVTLHYITSRIFHVA